MISKVMRQSVHAAWNILIESAVVRHVDLRHVDNETLIRWNGYCRSTTV